MYSLWIFVLTLIIVYIYKEVKRPPNYPPGPLWLPYIGNVLFLKKLVKLKKGLHLALLSLSQQYRSNIVGLKLGKELVVTVYDYPLIKDVLTKDEFNGRPDNFFFKMRTFGRRQSGITGSEGKVWSTNRHFVVRHLRNLGFGRKPMETLIKSESNDIVNYLRTDKSGINIGKYFAIRVLNVLWTLTCGERMQGNYRTLDDLLKLFNERGKCFDITGGILNMFPWLRFILPEWSGYNLIQKINGKLRVMVDEKIREHYENWTPDRNDDLMYCYISEIKKSGSSSVFCDEELTVVCFDFFIAGAQTTSGSLELLYFMMIINPEVQKKVHEELDRNLAKDHVLEYTDEAKLPYTSAVILETQRYLPVLPIIGPRRATKDTTLGGYDIPQDTTILLSLHAMNRNHTYWNNADSFIPERFLDLTGNLKEPENYTPFGLGKRRCLGDVLAKECIFYFFVETMRNFTVVFTEDYKPVSEKFTAGITLLTDYRAKFVPRERIEK